MRKLDNKQSSRKASEKLLMASFYGPFWYYKVVIFALAYCNAYEILYICTFVPCQN